MIKSTNGNFVYQQKKTKYKIRKYKLLYCIYFYFSVIEKQAANQNCIIIIIRRFHFLA